MSNTALLYTNPGWLGFQDYIGTRDVITWAPLKFSASDYASVSTYSDTGYWAPKTVVKEAVTVGDIEHNYIRKVFRELDKVLEPEFLETSPSDADIILMGLLPDKDDIRTYGGGGHMSYRSPYPQPSARGPKMGYAAWIESTGKNHLDQWEMGTILHEIGHALFLTHPMDGKGENYGSHPDFDVSISVMSYNNDPKAGGSEPVWYRDLDIHTLQDIWGKESNPEPADWPATETFPAVIDHLPYTPPVVVSPIIEKSSSANNTNLSQSEIDDFIEGANAISNLESTTTTAADESATTTAADESTTTTAADESTTTTAADESTTTTAADESTTTTAADESTTTTAADESTTTTAADESTITATADGFEAISQRKVDNTIFKLSKKIQNKWWTKKIHKKIGGDKEMEVYIHSDGGVIGSKKFRKQGKPDAISQVEMDFMVDLLNDIAKISGLDFKLIEDSSSADLVIAPTKLRGWEYYADWHNKKSEPWFIAWDSDGKDGMTTQEKNLCSQVILASIGLRELSKKGRKRYSTFHTIMSWDDEEYYGFTQADKHAITSLWGKA